MKQKKTSIRKRESAVTLTQLKNVIGIMSHEVNTNINSLKDEIGGLRDEMHSEISGMKGEIGGLKGEIGGLREDMLSEIGGLRDEMHSEIGGMKGEIGGLKGDIGKIDDKISNLYAMMQQDFAKKEDLIRLEMRVEALEIG